MSKTGPAHGHSHLNKPGNIDKKLYNQLLYTNNRRPRVRMHRSLAELMVHGDLSDWDEEELRRGQRRDKNGGFHGRPPAVVPKILHDELTRRTLSEAKEVMRKNLVAAAESLKDIAIDEDMPPGDRVKAIDLIMNRVMGKSPEKVEISAEKNPYEELLEDVERDIDPDEEVIDLNDWPAEDE